MSASADLARELREELATSVAEIVARPDLTEAERVAMAEEAAVRIVARLLVRKALAKLIADGRIPIPPKPPEAPEGFQGGILTAKSVMALDQPPGAACPFSGEVYGEER